MLVRDSTAGRPQGAKGDNRAASLAKALPCCVASGQFLLLSGPPSGRQVQGAVLKF